MKNYLKGKSIKLEKEYCRLSSTPNENDIRPYDILLQAFPYVMKKYHQETKNYTYIKDQLLGIRQEMVIQNIKNFFTIKVYEESARIALDNNDLLIFNQCQSGLIHLYNDSNIINDTKGIDHRLEFLRYRLLYTCLIDIKELESVMCNRYYKEYKEQCKDIIKFASWINEKNYIQAIKLSKSFTIMEQKLLHPFILRLKIISLYYISYAYYTEISIAFLTNVLDFDSNDLCIAFLKELKVIFTNTTNEKIKCKESISIIQQSTYLNQLTNS